MIVIWLFPSDSLVTMGGLPNIAIHAMAVMMRTRKFAIAVSCLLSDGAHACNEWNETLSRRRRRDDKKQGGKTAAKS
jgi:hypothetical protein